MRYGIVGALGAVCHLATLAVLVESGLVSPLPASVAGFAVALAVSYVLNLKWSFRTAHMGVVMVRRYVTVSAFGFGINLIGMAAALHLFSVWYLWAQLICVLLVAVTNFSLNRNWTFSPNHYGP